MFKNYKRILTVMIMALAFAGMRAQAQDIITQWTFDGDVFTPSIGAGSLDTIGGTTTSFVSGNPGAALNTTTYPEQGIGSGTAGIQFNVSTAGNEGITLTWDNRHSNTAANRLRLQYTTNGTDWINFDANDGNATNTNLDGTVNLGFDNGRYVTTQTGAVFFKRSADLSSISAIDNNANFAVRFVTEFETATEYGASNPANTYGTGGTIRYDNVTFLGGGGSGPNPSLSVNPSSLSGFIYLIGEGPSDPQTIAVSGMNLDPAAGNITVTSSPGFEVSGDGTTYGESVLLPYTDGELSATDVFVRMAADLPVGTYQTTLTVTGGGAPNFSVSVAGVVTSGMEPGISTTIIPRFIEGNVPNSNRLPFAYQATLINLMPEATYRYYNRVVLETEAPTSNGAGNIIFVNSDGTFTRTSSPNLGTAGAYGQFTTDAEGSYTGWFMVEPTGNATRFKPGTEIFMRIILNDGNEGTTEALRVTAEEAVKVLALTTSASDTAGTAIRGVSDFAAKNFVFLYDNAAGTGRPLYGTQIEASGLDFAAAGNYAPFYLADVATHAGAWGGIVPNVNAAGVLRIEERSRATGDVVASQTSANGVWGSTDTRNPSGGLEGVLVINTTVGIEDISADKGKVYVYDNVLNIALERNAKGTVQVLDLRGREMAAFNLSGSTANYRLDIPGGVYVIRLTTSEGTFTTKVFVK